MNVGKTLFAQVMQYVPWKTFGRIIERYGERGGARAGKPWCVSILTIRAGFSMAEMLFKLPPHGMISRAFLVYSTTTVADTIMNIAATQK